MALFKSARSFGKAATGTIAAFTMAATPVGSYYLIDEGLYGADHTTLSEAAGVQDQEYLENTLETLEEKAARLDQMEAQLGTTYRIARQTNDFERYDKLKGDINELKAEIYREQVNFYNNIYTNRSMSEQAMEDLMSQYRTSFGATIVSPDNARVAYTFDDAIDEDYARYIRDCQVDENMDARFVEPTFNNASEVGECARSAEKYQSDYKLEKFFAVVISLVAMGFLMGSNGERMSRSFETMYLNRKDKKGKRQSLKKHKLEKN